MLCCADVDYRPAASVAAGLVFREWADEHSLAQRTEQLPAGAPYEPGAFYRRELPCLLHLVQAVQHEHGLLSAVIIDGYVWLDGQGRPGLGAHLYEALGRSVPIVGVAKTAFHGASAAVSVLRGQSRSPLHVTAAGMDAGEAAQCVQRMHGPFRIPTLLKGVDRLCRTYAQGKA